MPAGRKVTNPGYSPALQYIHPFYFGGILTVVIDPEARSKTLSK